MSDLNFCGRVLSRLMGDDKWDIQPMREVVIRQFTWITDFDSQVRLGTEDLSTPMKGSFNKLVLPSCQSRN